MPMGLLINADFKKKLDIKLYRFDPKKKDPKYHAEIFSEMFIQFPQFKAHVAAYIERNYCFVVNDEDHAAVSYTHLTLPTIYSV